MPTHQFEGLMQRGVGLNGDDILGHPVFDLHENFPSEVFKILLRNILISNSILIIG